MEAVCELWKYRGMRDGPPAPLLSGPDPSRVNTQADLVAELDRLRRHAARGSQQARISYDKVGQRAGMPRSTVHAYMRGLRLPPADALDAIVVALGATVAEQAAWAGALDRVNDTLAALPPGQFVPPTPRQLPAAPLGFRGRADELRQIEKAIDRAAGEQSAPVVLLVGMGGVGKTALALRWAHASMARFPDGQIWLDLRGYSAGAPVRPGDALEHLLRSVGHGTAELPADIDSRAALFRSLVADRRMLLVLDNARDAGQVLPLLVGTPGFVTMVTSRVALRPVIVEHGAARIAINRLPSDDAFALLAADLPDETADAVRTSHIVEQCGGLPLALRIARERLSEARPDAVHRYAAELDANRRANLEAFDLNDSSVDVSLRGTLRWSYQALPDQAARLFRRLPLLLTPTFDLDCVAAAQGATEAETRTLLDVLVAASLLETDGSDRYRIHDLVAAFGAERLAAEESADDKSEARHRLLHHLAVMTQIAGMRCQSLRAPRLPWPDQLVLGHASVPDRFATPGEAQTWIVGHVDLLAAAVDDAAQSGPVEYAWLIGERAFFALFPVAYLDAVRPALEVACATALANGATEPARLMMIAIGICFGRSGELAAAERAFEKAIALARDAGDREFEGVTTGNLALVWLMQGDLERALHSLTATIENVGEENRVPPLFSVVEVHEQRGDLDSAEHALGRIRQSALIRREAGLWYLEEQFATARIELRRRRLDRAERRLRAIERVLDSNDNLDLRARTFTALSGVSLLREDLSLAAADARAALAYSRTTGARQAEVTALIVLAEIECAADHADESLRQLGRALERSREGQLPYPQAQAQLVRAKAHRALGAESDSIAAAEAARDIAARCGYTILLEHADALLRGDDVTCVVW